MSRQAEPSFAEAVIDGPEFARLGRRLSGAVPVAALSRLADVLTDVSGTLDCEVRGEHDKDESRDGKDWLDLRIEGKLALRCQRCLETLEFPLRVEARLLLVTAGEPWPEEEEMETDAFDAIEASRELDLLSLIEDEALLALPIAPRHEDCRPPLAAGDEQEPSPFAVLAGIRKH